MISSVLLFAIYKKTMFSSVCCDLHLCLFRLLLLSSSSSSTLLAQILSRALNQRLKETCLNPFQFCIMCTKAIKLRLLTKRQMSMFDTSSHQVYNVRQCLHIALLLVLILLCIFVHAASHSMRFSFQLFWRGSVVQKQAECLSARHKTIPKEFSIFYSSVSYVSFTCLCFLSCQLAIDYFIRQFIIH